MPSSCFSNLSNVETIPTNNLLCLTFKGLFLETFSVGIKLGSPDEVPTGDVVSGESGDFDSGADTDSVFFTSSSGFP